MKVALALTLLASPALLAHAAEGTRGGGEEEESSPKTLAWFVHMPKTAGTWLLNKFAQCLGDCSRPSAHGPRGTLVENFVEMGLVTAAEVTASLHNTKQKCGIREGAHRDYVARCEARGNTRNTPWNEKSWQKDRPVVCGSTAQHWPYEYSLELKRRVVKAGLRPVIIGSMRHPITYYVSHYFYALKSQRMKGCALNGKKACSEGGLSALGPEHNVCHGELSLSLFLCLSRLYSCDAWGFEGGLLYLGLLDLMRSHGKNTLPRFYFNSPIHPH